ncbi:protein FAM216A [Brachyhypopomus gauderio]|uniref:protein FAM216A n=1 Tax=Brachyhypopomus gauderio TaxID=698409 RepID=UPI004041D9A5
MQCPGLTPGQKHYLYAVDEAYGKDRVRKLIQQHYLNVIRGAARTGVWSPEWPSTDTDLMANLPLRSCTPVVPHSAKKKHSGEKADRQKPRITSGTTTLVLPNISHQQSLTSRDPETNVRKSKQTKKKSNNDVDKLVLYND